MCFLTVPAVHGAAEASSPAFMQHVALIDNTLRLAIAAMQDYS